ncbi:MAG TPA: MBL fold metallo-hydrolase [Thermoanaerobaculia bacterium]|nr:MBL fold metallo-hydrolase [Thermoanaerobaculia bacterium]
MSGQQAIADAREAAPRVVILAVRNGEMKNYNYLVVEPETLEAVIVDPAWEIDTIEAAIAAERATLRGILVTHSHRDHIDLARPLAEKYDCPIWMSKTEIGVSGFSARQLAAIESQPWTVGKLLIEPLFTPGHTRGSTCYLVGDNLFTGDVLFSEGCGICADTEAAHAMFASLERIKNRVGPQTRIFPGHSYGQQPGRTMAQLLQENIYLQFSDKESFAAFRLRRGQDKARLFNFS